MINFLNSLNISSHEKERFWKTEMKKISKLRYKQTFVFAPEESLKLSCFTELFFDVPN